jgi:hypothetical protein
MSSPTPPSPPTPPPAPPTPGAAIAQVQSDVTSDVAATKAAVQTVAAQARVEYDALEEAAKARIHTLISPATPAVTAAATHPPAPQDKKK